MTHNVTLVERIDDWFSVSPWASFSLSRELLEGEIREVLGPLKEQSREIDGWEREADEAISTCFETGEIFEIIGDKYVIFEITVEVKRISELSNHITDLIMQKAKRILSTMYPTLEVDVATALVRTRIRACLEDTFVVYVRLAME